MKKTLLLLSLLFTALTIGGCSTTADVQPVSMHQLALDSAAEIISQHLCKFDGATSFDGKGSIKISATDSMVVQIANVTGLDIENALLVFRAHIKSNDLRGNAYLEMWCQFDGAGEFFSRDLATPVTGSTDWTVEETPFFLKSGQRPDRVKLNLVVTGPGTVWIDDIDLLKVPMQ